MANEDVKVEYIFCFVALIVGSVMNPDICMFVSQSPTYHFAFKNQVCMEAFVGNSSLEAT
jgi:hypothetical protein